MLRLLGCEGGQAYLFGRPLLAEAFSGCCPSPRARGNGRARSLRGTRGAAVGAEAPFWTAGR